MIIIVETATIMLVIFIILTVLSITICYFILIKSLDKVNEEKEKHINELKTLNLLDDEKEIKIEKIKNIAINKQDTTTIFVLTWFAFLISGIVVMLYEITGYYFMI